MTKHNCDRCGNDEDAMCRRGGCLPLYESPTGIPEPEVGGGFEFCDKDSATEANLAKLDCTGWLGWEPLHRFFFDDEPHLYRFRRPIRQPETEPSDGYDQWKESGSNHDDTGCPVIQKSPARLETEANASNELSREFLLATIAELADAWNKCGGSLVMKPDAGVPRFVSAMGVVNTIAFNQGKRV